MEISSDRSTMLVNSIKPRPTTSIWMNGKTLEEVNQFNYLGSGQTKDGASKKVSKDQTGTSTLSHDKASNTMEKQSHQVSYNIKLTKSIFLSILLYGYESWTLTADLDRGI